MRFVNHARIPIYQQRTSLDCHVEMATRGQKPRRGLHRVLTIPLQSGPKKRG